MESLLSQDERAEKYNHSDDDDDAGDDGGPDQDIDAEAAQSPESSSTSPTHTFKSAVLKVRRGLAFAGVSKRRKSEMVPTVGRSLCAAELGTDFRIMDRRAAFGQSRGRWALHNIWSRKGWRGGSLDADAEDAWSAVSQLLLEDVYHTFLDAKFSIQILCFVVSYLVSFFVFAALLLSHRQSLQPEIGWKLDQSIPALARDHGYHRLRRARSLPEWLLARTDCPHDAVTAATLYQCAPHRSHVPGHLAAPVASLYYPLQPEGGDTVHRWCVLLYVQGR